MALPWVPVEDDYRFCTVDGQVGLGDLFGDCSQLLVYHLMMGPDWTEACSGCTYTADSFDRAVDHLPHRDVAFVAVSRAPVTAIEPYRARMGWSFRTDVLNSVWQLLDRTPLGRFDEAPGWPRRRYEYA